MDQALITKYVIKESKKGRTPNDIILTICQRAGMQWPDAEQLVKRIQTENWGEIKSSANRYMLLASILTLVSGLGMCCAAVFITIGGTMIILLSIPIP